MPLKNTNTGRVPFSIPMLFSSILKKLGWKSYTCKILRRLVVLFEAAGKVEQIYEFLHFTNFSRKRSGFDSKTRRWSSSSSLKEVSCLPSVLRESHWKDPHVRIFGNNIEALEGSKSNIPTLVQYKVNSSFIALKTGPFQPHVPTQALTDALAKHRKKLLFDSKFFFDKSLMKRKLHFCST